MNIILCVSDRTACVFDNETGHVICRYTGHHGSVNTAQPHPTEPLFCTASGDCTVHIWQLSGDPAIAPPVQRLQGYTSVYAETIAVMFDIGLPPPCYSLSA